MLPIFYAENPFPISLQAYVQMSYPVLEDYRFRLYFQSWIEKWK